MLSIPPPTTTSRCLSMGHDNLWGLPWAWLLEAGRVGIRTHRRCICAFWSVSAPQDPTVKTRFALDRDNRSVASRLTLQSSGLSLWIPQDVPAQLLKGVLGPCSFCCNRNRPLLGYLVVYFELQDAVAARSKDDSSSGAHDKVRCDASSGDGTSDVGCSPWCPETVDKGYE